ncbi:MAG: hypothetical protein K0S23_361 [Fluviicola sp.]|jgi:hypothetical protein|uniref:hypothetical protein n=1 Tax=Fluviicola sp. TaxID=1917219 RepID=UPI00263430F4|nr:hypothetical protein [Fluviicola sp.]MDF3026054.1 hypothetical protein [Fluviicola sp.]
MKLSKVWLNRIEGIGLVLILFSFFAQSFQNDSENSFRESQNYHLNKKLDHIWIWIGKQYSERGSEEPFSLKSAHKDWEFYSRQSKELESWENKIELFEQFGTWIFVLGTVLVIAPKFLNEE